MDFQVYSTRMGYEIEMCSENYLKIFEEANIPYRKEMSKNGYFNITHPTTIVTLNSLEDLMNLSKELPYEIIVRKDETVGVHEIEIYDDYRE